MYYYENHPTVLILMFSLTFKFRSHVGCALLHAKLNRYMHQLPHPMDWNRLNKLDKPC